eukprot:s96_g37.t1
MTDSYNASYAQQDRKQNNRPLYTAIAVRDPLVMVASAYCYHRDGHEPLNKLVPEKELHGLGFEDGAQFTADRILPFIQNMVGLVGDDPANRTHVLSFERLTESSESFDKEVRHFMDFMFPDHLITEDERQQALKAARAFDARRNPSATERRHSNSKDCERKALAASLQMKPNMLRTLHEPGKAVSFRTLNARPVLLSQVMGAESGLQMGDEVEALKPGRFFKDTWIPSMWKKAKVVAVNYDGTYDLQFEMNYGPYREQRTKGLRGTPTLSLRRNEQFKEYAADHMPASFRLFQEMNYQLSVSPNNIRMPGMLDRIANMQDTDATQDWYLCSNKNFIITSSPRGRDAVRLDEYSRRFLFGYRWVPTGDGDLRFEPVPNATQAQSLRACHKDTAMQFANAAQIDESERRKIRAYKAEMKHFEEIIGDLRAKPHQPTRPAGPRLEARLAQGRA